MASTKVEIYLPSLAAWTDVSTYVDAASVRQGRTDETNSVSPGTVTVDLYNDGGRFTPGLASGAYYPDIKPNRYIRVSVTATTTTFLFIGKIDSIVPSWDGGVRPVATITATDAMKGLQRQVSQSFYAESVLADSTLSSVAFYPLSEPSDASSFGSVTPSNMPGIAVQKDSKYGSGTITPGQGVGFLTGTPAATYCDMTFSGSGNTEHMTVIQVTGGASQNGPVLAKTGSWTIGCWFKRSSAPVDSAMMLYAGAVTVANDPASNAQAANASLFMDSVGHINFSITDSSGVTTLCRTAVAYSNGVWHYVTASLFSDAKTLLLFVDAENTGIVMTNALTSRFPDLNWIVAGGQLTAQNDSRYGWGGSLANLEFYTGSETSLAHGIRWLFAKQMYYINSDTGSIVQSIAQNFGFSQFGFPFVIANTGVTTRITPFNMEGSTYLDILQQIEKTEQGLLYVRGDGTLVFRNRGYRVNQVSAFTLDASKQEVAPDFQTGEDDSLLFNDYAATRPGGAVIRVRDTTSTSIADNGVYTNSATDAGADSILVTTDAEVAAYASYKIANYSQPRPRTPQITVDLKRAPDLWPKAQLADLGIRFTVINLPPEAPSSTMDFIIESVNWSFSGRNDTCTLVMNTSPADVTKYFRWDDTTYGQFDAGNAWFY